MILCRTPTRISFVGGGSDMAPYYRRHGGAVVSTAIDRFIYLAVNEKFDHRIRLSYSKREDVERASDIQHPIIREVLADEDLSNGLEVAVMADIPSFGTGLGSSSSFTVGFLNAMHALRGRIVGKRDLAERACRIEIGRLNEPIGKQDQYAAAFGGFNFIRFNPDDTVEVEPLTPHGAAIEKIESSLLVLYTGITRQSSTILREQRQSLESEEPKRDFVGRMVRLAEDLRRGILAGNVDDFGDIMHEAWMLKRQLTSSISSEFIDGLYGRARCAGAAGGKLLGAGGGGFLLLTAHPGRHEEIAGALPELRRVPVKFEASGSTVVFKGGSG
jgi:D-glycero-alpha-D-manno-heptose-7-phosphate kinase